MKYKVTFINEDRTTLKYKIARDVSNFIKGVANRCSHYVGKDTNTSYTRIGGVFSKLARANKMMFDTNEFPLSFQEVKVNDKTYDLGIYLRISNNCGISAKVVENFIFIYLEYPNEQSFIDDMNDTMYRNQVFENLKSVIYHEFVHIYDNADFDNLIHYSKFQKYSDSWIYKAYYLTDYKEINAHLGEFYTKNKDNKNYTFEEFIYDLIGDDLNFASFLIRYILSFIKNDRTLYRRYWSVFSKDYKRFDEENLNTLENVREWLCYILDNNLVESYEFDKKFKEKVFNFDVKEL